MAKRVLIIDDSIDILSSMRLFLEVNGFDVSTAENGKIALEQLHTDQILPDVIILDTMMPIMDGFEFRKEQLKNKKFAQIPTLVTTALPTNAIAEIDHEQFPHILKKPIDVEEILAFLNQQAVHKKFCQNR